MGREKLTAEHAESAETRGVGCLGSWMGPLGGCPRRWPRATISTTVRVLPRVQRLPR